MTDATEVATEAELEFVRDYSVDVARLWRAVTDPVHLVQWFGPQGTFIDGCEMDLTRTGPWDCRMRGKESMDVFRVSGVVTSVRPPEAGKPGGKAEGEVSFTWAWHDGETGARGAESFVTFRVAETSRGARLTLRHVQLADAESARNHTLGWTSTLEKLDRFFGQE